MCVDVTDEASVQEAVGQILLERGSIEILVNCAGFGYFRGGGIYRVKTGESTI